jgi:hypothetical protein
VNAAGARVDGLIAGSELPSLDWDGIWDARTARVSGGWSAKIVNGQTPSGMCIILAQEYNGNTMLNLPVYHSPVP